MNDICDKTPWVIKKQPWFVHNTLTIMVDHGWNGGLSSIFCVSEKWAFYFCLTHLTWEFLICPPGTYLQPEPQIFFVYIFTASHFYPLIFYSTMTTLGIRTQMFSGLLHWSSQLASLSLGNRFIDYYSCWFSRLHMNYFTDLNISS